MAGVYSVCFAHFRMTGVGAYALYTPPADKVAVVRDIVMYMDAGLGPGLLGVFVDTGQPVVYPAYIYKEAQATDQQTYHWVGHQTLRAGDVLCFYLGVDTGVVRVSGYELSL